MHGQFISHYVKDNKNKNPGRTLKNISPTSIFTTRNERGEDSAKGLVSDGSKLHPLDAHGSGQRGSGEGFKFANAITKFEENMLGVLLISKTSQFTNF